MQGNMIKNPSHLPTLSITSSFVNMADLNATYIHGSIPKLGDGGQYSTLSQNISWGLNFFPYNRPGRGGDNTTHLGCISNNATLLDVCCTSLNGTFISSDEDSNPPSDNATDSRGISQWCMLPDTAVYNDYYNTQPALVTAFAECYNRTVIPANNPGIYTDNITVSSDVWRCELSGNYSGGNSFDYPSMSRQLNTNGAQQSAASRFSSLAVAGIFSLVVLKACAGF